MSLCRALETATAYRHNVIVAVRVFVADCYYRRRRRGR